MTNTFIFYVRSREQEIRVRNRVSHVYDIIFLKWRRKVSCVGMVTLHNAWIPLPYSQVTYESHSSLQLASGWCNAVLDTPATSARKDQISIGSLAQSGASLPSTALAWTPQSFTVDMEQVLSWIFPVKWLEPKSMLPKRICFDLCHITLCRQHERLHFEPGCVATKPSPLCRNINTITMPTWCIILEKWCYAREICSCALLSLMYSC